LDFGRDGGEMVPGIVPTGGGVQSGWFLASTVTGPPRGEAPFRMPDVAGMPAARNRPT